MRKYSVPYPGPGPQRGRHGSPIRGSQQPLNSPGHGDVSSLCSVDDPNPSRTPVQSSSRSEVRGQATRGKSSSNRQLKSCLKTKTPPPKKERQTPHDKNQTSHAHSSNSSASDDVQIHEVSSSSEHSKGSLEKDRRPRRNRRGTPEGPTESPPSTVSRHSTRLAASLPVVSAVPSEPSKKRKYKVEEDRRNSNIAVASTNSDGNQKKRSLRLNPVVPTETLFLNPKQETPEGSPSVKKRRINIVIVPSSMPDVKYSKVSIGNIVLTYMLLHDFSYIN